MSTPEVDPKLTFALALLAGMFAQALARHLRLPGIVLLLIAGVSLGPDGLGWIQPRQLGDGLFAIVDFAVAIILFEGGLNLQLSRLRREGTAIRRLITFGAMITLVGGRLRGSCLDRLGTDGVAPIRWTHRRHGTDCGRTARLRASIETAGCDRTRG